MPQPDVGWLDPVLRNPVSVSDLLADISTESRQKVADACSWVIARLADDPAARVRIGLILRHARVRFYHHIAHPETPMDEVERSRGVLQGMALAEAVLTDPRRLADTRREMLGAEG